MINISEDYSIIDINKNAVIEASAGTGKTFTIVKIVEKILLELETDISKIVVVTFTEKAAGELKDRIRKSLIKKLNKNNPQEYKKINQILENFDNLVINTIHGFCNRILNEYAFENQESFQKEIADDAILYPKILHNFMRKEWPEYYGEYLEKILYLSDFENNPRYFENLIINITKKYKPELNDQIIPEPILENDLLKSDIDNFEKEINGLLNLIYYEPGKNIEEQKLYMEYEELKNILNKKSIETRKKFIIKPLIEFYIECNNKLNKIKAFKKFYNISSQCSGFDLQDENKELIGYNVLFHGALKKGNENYDFIYNHKILYNIITALEKIRKKFINLNKILLSSTAYFLTKSLRIYKQENALISYDDMLYLIYNSVIQNENFLKILQYRFNYALVDEFQDTDRIQWSIFKKIFIENTNNRLFVIGDPKQSIYGFRNADVYTYIHAKDEMITKYNANYYYLNTNWRSTKNLINDFNLLFNYKEWFNNASSDDPDLKKINYIPVKLPEEKKMQSEIVFPGSNNKRNLNGINLFKIDNLKKEDTLYSLSKFIIREIKYLLSKKDIKIKIKDNLPRAINESDICIIVKTKKEAEIIEEQLRNNKIKSTFYKKAGLYQSNEAIQLKYLLSAIAFTEDTSLYKKSLLTDFFNINIKDVIKYTELLPGSKIQLLFTKWTILAEKRKWSKLFNSILYESGLLYRLVYEEKKLNINSDRIITNYKHILENLEYTAINKRFDIFDIVQHLTNLINKAITGNIDEDLHRIETEEDKIKIMTIHVSKGLEFPIVFLFHSFTKSDQKDFYKFHEKNNIFYDLTKNQKNQIKDKIEEEQEEKRLYYVAFTRAGLKLYLPYFNNIDNKRLESSASIIKRSIENIINNNYFLSDQDYNYIELNDYPDNWKSEIGSINIGKSLFPKINRDEFVKRKITTQSFSSLHNKILLKIPDEVSINDFGEDKKETDEQFMDNDFSSVIEENDLPGGRYTGDMFHKIFENIDFKKINKIKNSDFKKISNDMETKNLVEKYFKIYLSRNIFNLNNETNNIYFNKVLEIIYNTLSFPINNENFILSALQNENRLHEVEFYLPVKNNDRDTDIFLNGYIDMIFREKNRYYILDWKSNYLKNGYHGKLFREEVIKNYELQYQIYLTALIEWLKNNLNNFDYEKNFGGIYYIYLRGIGTDKDILNNGVFYYKPGKKDFEVIKSGLYKKIIEKIS